MCFIALFALVLFHTSLQLSNALTKTPTLTRHTRTQSHPHALIHKHSQTFLFCAFFLKISVKQREWKSFRYHSSIARSWSTRVQIKGWGKAGEGDFNYLSDNSCLQLITASWPTDTSLCRSPVEMFVCIDKNRRSTRKSKSKYLFTLGIQRNHPVLILLV